MHPFYSRCVQAMIWSNYVLYRIIPVETVRSSTAWIFRSNSTNRIVSSVLVVVKISLQKLLYMFHEVQISRPWLYRSTTEARKLSTATALTAEQHRSTSTSRLALDSFLPLLASWPLALRKEFGCGWVFVGHGQALLELKDAVLFPVTILTEFFRRSPWFNCMHF